MDQNEKSRWVEVYTDGDQQAVCLSCAKSRMARGIRVTIQVTLRCGVATCSCMDCRKYGQEHIIRPAKTPSNAW